LNECGCKGAVLFASDLYKTLLDENRIVLKRLAARHDLSGKREVDIGSRYGDLDTAVEARKYIKDKYVVPKGVLFHVMSRKYSETEKTIDLTFSLEIVVEAELITQYEFMLHDAAERFGGEVPGWEISPR
jgi:hypothetical protein